jgi:hypothetical protein
MIEDLLAKSVLKGIPLNPGLLEMEIRRCFESLTSRFLRDTEDLSLLESLDDLAAVVGRLPFKVNLRTAQNISYRLLQSHFPWMKQRADKGDEGATRWVRRFQSLCERISVRVLA